MKIMVIGGGGREHAIVHSIAKSPLADEIYALPGNGGIAAEAICVPIKADDIDSVVGFACENKIDFAIVAPDDPLVLGMVDALEDKGIKCFGPEKKAALIEGSKVFSKNLMKKYGIPTAGYEVFDDPAKAYAYVKEENRFPTVIKADGLALGKGVVIAADLAEAKSAVDMIMKDKVFGKSGNTIVVEEYLTGPEVSVLCFTDGQTICPMVSSMDHKRAHDGDKGPNTGGMGTVAPNPFYTPEIADECMNKIFMPTVNAMNKEGRTFKGCLYFGLMLTENGPKVIEYNCRFGDPETQVVLPLLESDLLDIMIHVRESRLSECDVRFSGKSACCVVVASDGYPKSYEKGFEITESKMPDNCFAYHAGTAISNGKVVTSGGRVAGVTAVADSLGEAVKNAYEAAECFEFKNKYSRSDIGQKALSVIRERME